MWWWINLFRVDFLRSIINEIVFRSSFVASIPENLIINSYSKVFEYTNFYNQFKDLGITRELNDSIDNWSYDKLDEVNRIAPIIKTKMKSNGII